MNEDKSQDEKSVVYRVILVSMWIRCLYRTSTVAQGSAFVHDFNTSVHEKQIWSYDFVIMRGGGDGEI